MERKKVITDSEWEIMEILWEESPINSREIVKRLGGVGWKPTTIRTLLARLVKKEFVGFVEGDYAYTYHPLVSREEMVLSETDHLIEKLYKGNLGSMLSGFAGKRKLTPEDKEELKKLLKNN